MGISKSGFALAAFALAAPTLALPRGRTTTVQAATVQAASSHCGNTDYVILSNTPWIVYNMLYNVAVTVGTQCTNYESWTTNVAGAKEVTWSSVTDIEYVQST